MSDDVTTPRGQADNGPVVETSDLVHADESAAGSRGVPLPVVETGDQPVVLAGSLKWQLWVWPLLAAAAVGLSVLDSLIGLLTLAALLLSMATLRLFERPEGRWIPGSRRRWFDVMALGGGGIAIVVLSLTIPSLSW